MDINELKEFCLEKDPSLSECQKMIDELAMVLYSFICNWLVSKINISLQSSEDFHPSQLFICIVDQYGYNSDDSSQSVSDFFINGSNEKVTQLFCHSIKESLGINLHYNDGCIESLHKIHQIAIEQFMKPTTIDNFTSDLQKLANSNPFAELSKQDNSISLEFNHFFKNISYNVQELLLFSKFSNSSTMNRVIDFSLKSLSIWMNSDFLESYTPNYSCTLFSIELFDLLDDLTRATKSHYICCIDPKSKNNNESISFSNSVVLEQLKIHGIIKLAESYTKLISNPILGSSSVDNFGNLVHAVSDSSVSRKRKRRSIKLYRATSKDKMAPFAHLLQKPVSISSSHSATDISDISTSTPNVRSLGQPKEPKRPISIRLKEEDLKRARFEEEPEIINIIIPSESYSWELSTDNLSEITVPSNEDDDDNDDFRQNEIQSNSLILSGSNSEIAPLAETSKNRRDEFLFLYSCGSLLRTLYQTGDNENNNLITPRKDENQEIVNPHGRVRSKRHKSFELKEPVPLKQSVKFQSKPSIETFNIKLRESKTETPEQDNSKTVRLRKHKSILPLLHLESGDAIINQINYNNPIRTTPRRQKSLM